MSFAGREERFRERLSNISDILSINWEWTVASRIFTDFLLEMGESGAGSADGLT